jgi:hypothetical protein
MLIEHLLTEVQAEAEVEVNTRWTSVQNTLRLLGTVGSADDAYKE